MAFENFPGEPSDVVERDGDVIPAADEASLNSELTDEEIQENANRAAREFVPDHLFHADTSQPELSEEELRDKAIEDAYDRECVIKEKREDQGRDYQIDPKIQKEYDALQERRQQEEHVQGAAYAIEKLHASQLEEIEKITDPVAKEAALKELQRKWMVNKNYRDDPNRYL